MQNRNAPWANDPVVSGEEFTAAPTNYRPSNLPLAPLDPGSSNLSRPQGGQSIPLPPPPAPPMPGRNATPWANDPIVSPQVTPQTPRQSNPNTPWANDPVIQARRTFDNIYQDQELARTAQEFYRQRDGEQLGAREAIDKFISDRTWRDANVVSTGRELIEASQMDDDQKRRLGYLRQYWNELPSFWAEGGRGARGLLENVAKGALDPTIVVGPLAGKAASAIAGRTLGRLTQAGISVGTDAAISTGANVASQATDIEVGNRQSISLGEAALAGAIGGGASALGAVAVAGLTPRMPEATGNAALDAQRNMKIGAADPDVNQNTTSVVSRSVQQMFDRYHPIGQLQKDIRGTDPSARGYADAIKTLKPTDRDPINDPWYQLRLTAASGYRARDMLVEGGILPPEMGASIADNSYRRNTAPALDAVVKPLRDAGQLENWNMYVMALRARFIRDVVNPHKEMMERAKVRAEGRRRGETPQGFAQRIQKAGEAVRMPTFFDDAQVFLDAGVTNDPNVAAQLAQRSIDDWIRLGDNTPGFKEAAENYSKIMDNALEYQRISGVVSADDISRMKWQHIPNMNNVPFFYGPFYHAENASAASSGGASGGLSGIPAKLRMSGSTGNRMDLINATAEYMFRAVQASDMNRAKLSFYDMLQEGINNGKVDPDAIASRVRMDQASLLRSFYADPDAADMLRRAGIYDNIQSVAPEDILRVISINNWRFDKNVDIVFRDGKAEFWRINDPAFLDALKPFAEKGQLDGIFNFANAFARFRATAITANPIFISKNMIRDTISSAFNSAYGFIPGYSTGRAVISAVSASNEYRRALANGMGYSSRVENDAVRGLLESSKGAEGGGAVRAFYNNALAHVKGNYLSRGLEGYLDLANRFEQASRLAEYRLAKQAGASDMGAAFMGREVATDFGGRGANKVLGAYANASAFFNASLQGLYKLGNTVRTQPGKVILLGAALSLGTDVPFHLMNMGHPQYEALNPAIKAQNMLVPDPVNYEEYVDWITGKRDQFTWRDGSVRNVPEIEQYIPIPKPFDFGHIGTIINGTIDALARSNGQLAVNAFVNALSAMVPGFGAPDIMEPALDLALNKDWLGNPITPQRFITNNTPNVERWTERTPEWAKDASRALSWSASGGEGRAPVAPLSPIEIEYLANYIFAGALSFVPQIATSLTQKESERGASPTPRGDEPSLDNPFGLFLLRSWQIETPLRNSDNLNKFYELRNRVNSLATSDRDNVTNFVRVVGYDPNARPEEISAATAWSPTIRSVALGLQQLDQAAVAIRNDQNMTGDRKRLELDRILQQKDDMARSILTQIRGSREGEVFFRELFNQNPSQNLPARNLLRESGVGKQMRDLLGGNE